VFRSPETPGGKKRYQRGGDRSSLWGELIAHELLGAMGPIKKGGGLNHGLD